jgi:hypothetical protein
MRITTTARYKCCKLVGFIAPIPPLKHILYIAKEIEYSRKIIMNKQHTADGKKKSSLIRNFKGKLEISFEWAVIVETEKRYACKAK